MKQLLSIILLLCAVQNSMGQSYTIKGVVLDTMNNTPLARASIVLIRGKDSVIESFSRSRTDGSFEIHAGKGKYKLRITFPGFADYVDGLDINNNITDLGNLPMISKAHLLNEFVITRQIAAIKIKGDTTEYVADSFKVKEGANVEDLLRRLPGIQVDQARQDELRARDRFAATSRLLHCARRGVGPGFGGL